MEDWLEKLIKEIIWKAFQDAIGKLSSLIEEKLAELTPGKKLASSPLVAVVASDETSVTLLVRGRFKLWDGAAAPFMRVQVKVSKELDDQLSPPIQILEWQTVIGDLLITKKNLWSMALGFGWDQGTVLCRLAAKVIPAGLGFDILVQGLDEQGLVIGIDADLPSPIPLGASGLALSGVGGDFAYNFIARLNNGVPKPPATTWDESTWDASDYVAWAQGQDVDRWVAGPPEQTAVGIGLRADLRDIMTMGWLLSLGPIGLAVLTPGPVFILGGRGRLLNSPSIEVEGYTAVDVASQSMALGLGLKASVPPEGKLRLLHAKGSMDAYFSLQRPSDWYLRLGTNKSPIAARILDELEADVFLMLGHDAIPKPDGTAGDGVFFGVGIAYGAEWKAWIVEVVAKIGARAALAVGWNPLELGGEFAIWGELGLKVWEIGLKILLALDVAGYVAEPTRLKGQAGWKLDLPWLLPGLEGAIEYSLGESNAAPKLNSPLLLGSSF